MRARIGRRYDALTKYLKEVIADPSRGHRVRMQAAMKLADILLQHDQAEARRELAELRAAGKQSDEGQTGEGETADTPAAEESVDERLRRLREQYGSK